MRKIKTILFLLVFIFTIGTMAACQNINNNENNNYPSENSKITIKEAKKIAIPEGDSTYHYYITGEIISIDDAKLGNFTIADTAGYSINVLYCFDKNGYPFSDISKVLKVGDTVTVYSAIINENGLNVLKGATLFEHIPSSNEPIEPDEPDNPSLPSEPTEITIEEAISIAATQSHNKYTSDKYIIEGVVSAINNITYGNLYIKDASGNELYIYGLYDEDGNRFDRIENQPEIGDTILILTVLGRYNDTLQAKSAVILDLIENEPQEPSGNDYKINFLMINDTHGAFTDSTDGNSIGRVDSLLDTLISKNGQYISIVNGDAFQGTYVSSTLYGKPLIDAFNAMNLSAFVVGNHDFDWGLDKMAVYKDGDISNGEANFPFLGANIYIKGTKTLPSFIEPYTVVEYGDLKVGVIGVIGGNQESDILTKHVEDYEFVNDPTSIVATHAKYLRTTLDCDSVVVATHDYNEGLNSKLAALEGNEALDAIFCAHTHQLINSSIQRADGKYISVVQNGDKNDTAMGVELTYNNGMYVSSKNNVYQPENYAISSDIQNIIGNYSDLIAESERILGTTSGYISKGTLGNYATRAILEYDYSSSGYDFGTIDMAIINTGGVRATVPSGAITAAEVFEAFPFENMVVLVNISGSDLKSVYKSNSSYLYTVTSTQAGDINNFSNNTIYQLAIIDYVFTSTLSSYNVFDRLDPSQYIYTDIILRNAVIEYIDRIY